jgi:3-mercaptopyruvate sulfurtransferase SseA
MSFMNLFTKTQESYSTVDCGELEQIIAQEGSNIQLIDVRTEGEHAGGHIPNSENINLMGPDFVPSWSFSTEKKHITSIVPAVTEAEQLVARWCTWASKM